MQRAKSVKPTESPADSDPLTRLVHVLGQEGFENLNEDENWQAFGERVYRRKEKVLFAEGETVFLLIDADQLSDKVVSQSIESLSNLFRARKSVDKVLAPLQSNTVYVCFVAKNEIPISANLSRHISTVGGSVLIPVIIVPEINQVVYPTIEEKVGTLTPRMEYLQYVLGERFEPANIHRNTIQTMYITMAIAAIIVIMIAAAAFM
jgi:hypothetical protein